VAGFNEKFDVEGDPTEVIIDFTESRIADMSAIDALHKLTERYAKLGKKLHLQHLTAESSRLLNNASSVVKVNILERS
jgi:SulP family sulfate permease